MGIYRRKEIIVFDLDGTLAESKGVIDNEMLDLLEELLKIKKIAVITGGAYPQIEKALLSRINISEPFLSNLYLFPTDATSFYRYENNTWTNIYKEDLELEGKEKIIKALKESMDEADYQKYEKTYGEIIEDRGSQITFSGLGQQAPLEEKLKWDPNQILRRKIIKAFEKRIFNYNAKIGGSTSIDINRKGIDKAYGIKQIEKTLNIPIDKMLFIGDALFEGGNDQAVIRTGIETIAVKEPKETKKIIQKIIL